MLAGGAVSELEADRERGFRWDLTEARRRIAGTLPQNIGVPEKASKGRPSLVFLCNPNNPTGV